MVQRVDNFGAGPAALPRAVLDRIHEELHNFDGSGRSILELSHRSPQYDRVHEAARTRLLRLLGAGSDYDVLFMTGGARTQFSLVPMNLLEPGLRGDYLVTGRWSQLALAAAEHEASGRSIWSDEPAGFRAVPGRGDYEVGSDAGYLHYTSNNTIYGTQFSEPPETAAPLVVDASSDFLSRPFDLAKHALVYASAQKNLGPAGVTVVVIRRDLIEGSREDLADMFSYRAFAAKSSLLNTPPVFAIYVLGLVLENLEERGSLAAAGRRSSEKADRLYQAIDRSEGFYRGHASPASRSSMNVTFRLPDQELEASFVEEAEARGLVGLKGHRSVGGVRASIYNGVGRESVRKLAEFLDEFRTMAAARS